MTATTDRVRCARCEAENDAVHTYCGACGMLLDAVLEPAAARPGGGSRARPWLLLISGGLCIVAGVTAMAAAFATAQAGPWGFGFGLADLAFDTNLSGDGGDSSLLITVLLLASFVVASLSFVVFACTALRLLGRRARRVDYREATRSMRERGGQEYAEAKPKIAKAAAGAGKAAATGRAWLDERRSRRSGRS